MSNTNVVNEENTSSVQMASFDGSKSASTAETIVDFIENFTWRCCEIQDVPGIGAKSTQALAKHGISTIQQLVGAYMGFVEPETESNEINNKFYKWFKEKSPNANGHTVTFAIAHLADKYGIVLYEN